MYVNVVFPSFFHKYTAHLAFIQRFIYSFFYYTLTQYFLIIHHEFSDIFVTFSFNFLLLILP